MGLLNETQQEYYQGNSFGGYQFISLNDVIDNFTATFVGEGKILQNVLRGDISFHAHRALAELSFDTFKSCKSQEIEVPPHLTMRLPQDYVNYVKLVWSDGAGIEHIIYPASKTSNPLPIEQRDDGDYMISATATMVVGTGMTTGIALDKEYKNILPGMTFNSFSMDNQVLTGSSPMETKIWKVRHIAGITTLYLTQNTYGFNGTETVNITPGSTPPPGPFTSGWVHPTAVPQGLLSIQLDSIHVVSSVTYVASEYRITASSSSDTTDIKPGMLVSSDQQIFGSGSGEEAFPFGTRVVAVDGTNISVDKPAIDSVTAAQVVFIDIDKVSDTWSKYKSATPSENQDDYQDDTYWPAAGERY